MSAHAQAAAGLLASVRVQGVIAATWSGDPARGCTGAGTCGLERVRDLQPEPYRRPRDGRGRLRLRRPAGVGSTDRARGPRSPGIDARPLHGRAPGRLLRLGARRRPPRERDGRLLGPAAVLRTLRGPTSAGPRAGASLPLREPAHARPGPADDRPVRPVPVRRRLVQRSRDLHGQGARRAGTAPPADSPRPQLRRAPALCPVPAPQAAFAHEVRDAHPRLPDRAAERSDRDRLLGGGRSVLPDAGRVRRAGHIHAFGRRPRRQGRGAQHPGAQARPTTDRALGAAAPASRTPVRGGRGQSTRSPAARISERLAIAGAPDCVDSVFAEPPSLDFGDARNGVSVSLGPSSLGRDADTIRTRCPGPTHEIALGEDDDEHPLAQGTIPFAALGDKTLSVSMGSGLRFSGGGYTGARRGAVTLDMRLLRSRVAVERIPG